MLWIPCNSRSFAALSRTRCPWLLQIQNEKHTTNVLLSFHHLCGLISTLINPHQKNAMPRICLFLCLFCSSLRAQSGDFQFSGKSIPEIRKALETPVFLSHAAILQPLHFPIVPSCADSVQAPLFFTPGLAQWKPEDLPFFCKIEHKMGKKLPVQFKFRLGSVDYVDWLEGKGHGGY